MTRLARPAAQRARLDRPLAHRITDRARWLTAPVLMMAALWAGAGLAVYGRTTAPASVVFHGTGPGGFKIEGKTQVLRVSESETSASIVVPLEPLTTGITLRDKHMREKYLEVAKYPEARLEVLKAALPPPPPAGVATPVSARGRLTLHGVTKEIAFQASVTCNSAGVCATTAKLPLNINDYGIVIPKYLGVTMKPDISVDVAFEITTK